MGKTELVKGSTEMILLSLLEDKTMYGYEIARKIDEESEGFLRFKEGTLYPTLKRLETHGWVESYWQQSNDGPRRKYYSITKTGKSALRDRREEWSTFQKVVNRMVGEPIG
ncbi:PadR family transcriptional regulator [Caldalkalibacillus salinus]|uniref:PadR family transcriptional regulator n=1 Tax=Caldalkalibacillus salinus TaxID=2803787 RepID=UPI003016D5CD